MVCPTIVGSVVGSDPSLLGGGQAAEMDRAGCAAGAEAGAPEPISMMAF